MKVDKVSCPIINDKKTAKRKFQEQNSQIAINQTEEFIMTLMLPLLRRANLIHSS